MLVDRDCWETPQKLWNKLNEQYNFSFDCCANDKNSKCFVYDSNFLENKGIDVMSWMNPPFSKAYEMFTHFFKVVRRGVAIYRCDNMETKVWRDVIFPNASWVFVFDKRISYEGQEGGGARFPSALIGYGVPVPKGLNGTILGVVKE